MRGTIEKVWENESRQGKPYRTLVIDGERYSLWDQRSFDQVREGGRVEYQWRRSGDFRTITEIEPVGAAPGDLAPEQIRMTRMGCLKYASHLLSGSELDPEARSEHAVAIARDFERYVLEPELDEGE